MLRALIAKFFAGTIDRVLARAPDVIIGGHDNPYLLRWFIIPRNPIFNIYLHQFLRSDDDRALHDHPWPWCSILLRGSYAEWSAPRPGSRFKYHIERFDAGDMRFLRPPPGTDPWLRVRDAVHHRPARAPVGLSLPQGLGALEGFHRSE
jgi:hypothetical protein